MRGEDQPDFSEDEIAFTARIGEHIAHGLRDAILRGTATSAEPDGAPGVIIVDDSFVVRSLTEQARFWLDRLPSDHGSRLELPAVVHAVARRALRRTKFGPEAKPYANVRLISGGWLSVHAAILQTNAPDKNLVAVTLAPGTVAELEPLRLALHGLTPREREVAQLVTRGITNDEIARSLWISRHTVKDHVKAIYAKLDVSSRAELSAKLFHEHIAPHLDDERVREFPTAAV